MRSRKIILSKQEAGSGKLEARNRKQEPSNWEKTSLPGNCSQLLSLKPFASRFPVPASRFGLLAVIAVISIIAFSRIAAGQTNNHQDRQRSLQNDERSDRPSSSLWRSYIWESLPTENLSGPDPDPISEVYQQHDWQPMFINSQFELNHTASQLLARLRTLENDAIDPRPFRLDELTQNLDKLNQCRSALRAVTPEIKESRAQSFSHAQPPLHSTTAAYANQSSESAPHQDANSGIPKRYQETIRAAAETDVRLTTAFIHFAKEMDPFLPKEETAKALLGEVPISDFLKELEPKTFNYEALRSAYAKYKKLAAQGDQQRVAITSKARHGESGNYIGDLQKRLRQEGFYSGNITSVYDSETQRAVKEFQAANLLDPDGTIGQRTKELLNVSFQQKADLIAYTMKAVRQSPSRANSTFIRINIPQFALEYYKDGQFQEAHRIVVGKAIGKKVKFRGKMVGENQTPTLSSSIEQIILNPRWYVSDRIRLELDNQAKADPEWFSKHGYVNMNSKYPWGAPRLFQSPGPKNALGRVKFEFPNPYAVYLHDTPLKHLFARSRRDFSHGCIRVDKALELAETLLRDDASPYASKMKSVLDRSHPLFVKLSHPIPISIEYIPVVATNSKVVFVGDLYGILTDDKLPERMKS